jgi:uncharacterized protein with gpF-like domain
MSRQQSLQQFIRAMTVFERKLLGQIGRARNSYIITAAARYQTLGSVPAWLVEAHKQRIANALDAHYRKVIPHFGAMAMAQIKSRKMEAKAQQDLFSSLAREWIAREALRKATMIAATDRDDVTDAINNGFADGLGTAEISRNIRKVSSLTPFRAATVARTETHSAATYGSIQTIRQAEQDLGVKMLKSWLPTQDDRTREDHAAMANEPAIPLDEKFNVGGHMMDRPGDPSAPAEQVINCRCALIYEEPA